MTTRKPIRRMTQIQRQTKKSSLRIVYRVSKLPYHRAVSTAVSFFFIWFLFLHDEYNKVSMWQFTGEKSTYRQLIGWWQRKNQMDIWRWFVKQECCIYGSRLELTGRKSPNLEMALDQRKKNMKKNKKKSSINSPRKSTIKATSH